MIKGEKRNVTGKASKSGKRLRMKAVKPPNWLPDGWIMEVGTTESGAKYKYYTSPVSGYTFHSKQEVLHYLNVIKVDGHVSETTSCSGDNKQNVVAQVKNSPTWLPAGWILEIKTRMSGGKAGQKYKCYFDPFTGSRFYSKADVFRFLKSGKLTPTSKQKRRFNASTADNVLAQIEYSPDGLPHGWIKEIVIRKSNKTRGIRKDPYYTDPVSGYVFRSLKDAIQYVETGELSKHAFGPRKKSISDLYSLEKESPPPISVKELKSLGTTVRRCLFTEEILNSNREMAMEIDESPVKMQLPYPDHASSKSVKKANLIYSTPNIAHAEGKTKKRRKVSEPATENLLEPIKHIEEKAEKGRKGRPKEKSSEPAMYSKGMAKKEGEMVLEPKVLEPEKVREKPSQPFNDTQLDSPESKQLKLAGEELSELANNEKPSKISNNKAQEPTVATPEVLIKENPLEQENVKHFEPKYENPPLEESNQSEPPSKMPSGPEDKPVVPENKKPSRLDRGVRKQGSRALNLPCRASKRLAGLEPAPASELLSHRPTRRSMSNSRLVGIKDPVPLGEPESMESIGEQADALGEQAVVAEKVTDERLPSPLALPFGDSWADPCIEFAVKTLIGEIPVLDEGIAIEEYIQKQLNSVETSNPSASATLDFDNQGVDQAELPAQLEPPEKLHLPVDDEGRPCPLKNRLPYGGKVTRKFH